MQCYAIRFPVDITARRIAFIRVEKPRRAADPVNQAGDVEVILRVLGDRVTYLLKTPSFNRGSETARTRSPLQRTTESGPLDGAPHLVGTSARSSAGVISRRFTASPSATCTGSAK